MLLLNAVLAPETLLLNLETGDPPEAEGVDLSGPARERRAQTGTILGKGIGMSDDGSVSLRASDSVAMCATYGQRSQGGYTCQRWGGLASPQPPALTPI